jgi:hypothetical protein
LPLPELTFNLGSGILVPVSNADSNEGGDEEGDKEGTPYIYLLLDSFSSPRQHREPYPKTPKSGGLFVLHQHARSYRQPRGPEVKTTTPLKLKTAKESFPAARNQVQG